MSKEEINHEGKRYYLHKGQWYSHDHKTAPKSLHSQLWIELNKSIRDEVEAGTKATAGGCSLSSRLKDKGVQRLYHVTQRENWHSICEHGLLSRRLLRARSIGFFDHANDAILDQRGELGRYVPLFFAETTPFLFALSKDDRFKYGLYVLSVDVEVVCRPGVRLSSANAAGGSAVLDCNVDDIDWKIVLGEYKRRSTFGNDRQAWDTYKKRRMSEVLVPHEVPATMIKWHS